jgi:hypothetical protein
MFDSDCWHKYTSVRHTIFNKLWVAEHMGYLCGPGGVDIPKTGK